MPVDWSRYPRNWKRIVRGISRRSQGRCEWCQAINKEAHPITGSKVVLTTAHLCECSECSPFVWIPIQGHEPMENCHTADGQEVGWIRPARIGKSRPQPWGTAMDWPGEWQAIPHRYDDEGQPTDWSLATYQPSYAAAKEWIELGWNHK